MPTSKRKLTDILHGLSPEAKAHLFIEDVFRSDPVASNADRDKAIKALRGDDGERYQSVISGFHNLRENVLILFRMHDHIVRLLLYRDRVLWYLTALKKLEIELTMDPLGSGAARILLADNPNLKVGKPVEVRLPFATLSLGVWGKDRSTLGSGEGVVLTDGVTDVLDSMADEIRTRAREFKALYRYIVEESESLDLDVTKGIAVVLRRGLEYYDASSSRLADLSDDRMLRWEEEGLGRREQFWRIVADPIELECESSSIFAVPDEWALVWEELDEDDDLANRVWQDPEGWSSDYLINQPGGVRGDDLLNLLKQYSKLE